MATARWSSGFGFILAAVGAAVDLENIWRFSVVVGQTGGGIYLVPHLIVAFVCAVPMPTLELAIGRRLRSDVVPAFRSIKNRIFAPYDHAHNARTDGERYNQRSMTETANSAVKRSLGFAVRARSWLRE
jgi:SNF family Na+-dependent transporter